MRLFVLVNSPVDTGRKLNVHKTFRRRPGRPGQPYPQNVRDRRYRAKCKVLQVTAENQQNSFFHPCFTIVVCLFVCFFATRKSNYRKFSPICPGGQNVPPSPPPPCRFFGRCILTCRTLKLILYDFSSNFILNM